MNETFNNCLELFKHTQNENLSDKTINRKVHEVNKLLLYFEEKGIHDFTVSMHLRSCSGIYRPSRT